ncbi:UDP-2,3-diacylglucosamine diphosphatase [Bradyrhizobium sp.]|jgi:UDP-2,3-diacylglucosamine pyrophosphatase LpxH|uniref:UDP-2,3-diacylglucosamine diphosphatase n=1 Tax=Bradyrhizobium TaxID=374 RepID=UPI000397A2E0|nr:MAG: nitrate/nitrite transport system permease [Bradyrhizobium sp. DFCI-1]
MRVVLSRLRPSSHTLESAAAALLVLAASYQFGVAASGGRYRTAEFALLVLAAGIYWHRSIFRRCASRDITRVLAGLAEAMATAFRRDGSEADRDVRLRGHGDRAGAVRLSSRHVVKVRSLFISDVHLGTRGCQAERLIDFLRHHDAETVFLVGDIVDGWCLRSSWYWPTAHNAVVRELIELAQRGRRLVYIPGNHDEFLRDYAGAAFGGVEVVERAIHRGLDGRDYLVVHGDHFDLVVRHARWLALIGDVGYRAALASNVWLNRIRRQFGFGYWSFSSWAKLRVKNAVNHIGRFEEVLSSEARRRNVQGVICGHIHHAAMHDEFGVRYINTGDWVESCTGVVERYDGQFEIVRWTDPQPASNAAGLAPLVEAVA